MGKLTAIKTKSIFQSLLNDSKISEQAIHFILDTGLIYTHGIYINGAAYGTEANGAVNLSIAGVTKALSLSTHTHSNYLEKNSNIDIGSYIIKSGNNELLKWASNKLILGSPTYITGTAHTTRNSTNYDILDTGNFSVVAKTSTNISLQNVATIKYGSSTFLIDYAKRINGAYTFDNITYTSIGTTNVNNQLYGIITMYTDGSTPASYALIRADIPNGKLEYRTSGSTAWKTIVTGALPTVFVGSGSNHASGLVPDPGATAGTAKFLCEDGTWKTPTYTSDTNTWRNILVNGTLKLSTAINSGGLDIINGTNTTVEWTSSNKLKINSVNTWTAFVGASADSAGTAGYVSAPGKGNQGKYFRGDGTWATPTNTWNAANTSQAGYIPKLTTGGGTIATQASEYVLVYVSSASGTVTPTWKLLPANAFKNDNTWKAANASQEGYVPKSTANKILRADGDGVLYWGDDANTKYSFSNLLFLQTSGTNLMTYNSQAVRTILAGSNITFTHSNNVLTITAKDTTYSTVSKSEAGLCPALPNETTTTKYLRLDGTWVTPPDNNTWNLGSSSLAGYVPLATKNYFLHCNNSTGALEWVANPNTNTWRGIYVGGSSKVGTGTGTLPVNFVAGSNVTITYEAAGTGSGLSGNAGYFNIKIASTNTWTAWKGATSSAAGTAGYMPAPTAAQYHLFLRGDGSWVSLNNYSLPTASNSTLGGVKTGVAITDITGYTAVHIKDGIIYYKDTTYSFYNLLFQNSGGTTVDTYKPTTSPTKTLKAGANVTISAASNVITIASTNTWNANAVGVAGYVAAPTKAANANMTWQTDAEGVPAWRASNNHSHSYLPLSGGQMTGPLTWKDGTALPKQTSPLYFVVIDAFASGGTTKWSSVANVKTALGLGSNAYTSTAYLPLSGGTLSNAAFGGQLMIERSGSTNMAAIGFKNSNGVLGYLATNTVDGAFVRYNAAVSTYYTILDSNNSSVSKSGETLTVKINGTSQSLTNTWRGIQNNLTSDSTTDSLSAALGKALNNKFGSYLPLSGGTMTGKITFSQGDSTRDVGIIGTYNPNKAAAIWSMGSSFQIKADGTTFGSLYGAAYAYFGSGYTFGAGYSNGHSLVWCLNGTIYAALGNSVWARGGFIKDGSSDSYVLLGGGGHKLVSDFATSGHNHNSSYVSAVSISGNNLRINKNGANTDLTIPYATNASSASSIASLGNRTTTTSDDMSAYGIYTYNMYNSAGTAPQLYMSAIGFGSGVSKIEIAGSWGDDYTGYLYWRSKSDRDISSYPWKSWRMLIDSTNISSQSVSYASTAGGASWAHYLPPKYDGGDLPNPQTYFNEEIGLRVAMTRYADLGYGTAWHDTLWINGYAGGDVTNMCALTFKRNGEPRFYISSQSNRSTSYGSMYEVITTYNLSSYVSGGSVNNNTLGPEAYVNGTTSELPHLVWHIPNVNWGNLSMDSNGTFFLRLTNSTSAGLANLYANLPDYLAKSGGTMTGQLSINKTGYALKWNNDRYSVGSNDSPNDFYMWSEDSTARFRLGTNSTERLTILANGNVGIGDKNPAYRLEVGGNCRISSTLLVATTSTDYTLNVGGNVGAANYYTTSDIRKKYNIKPISNLLPIYEFNWKSDGSKSYGFIAQWLELTNPELVSGEDYKHVNYNATLALYLAKLSNIVEETKEDLYAKIAKLEARIKELETSNKLGG